MSINTHSLFAASCTDDRFLSARDAAHELGICVSLFWKLNKTGDIPAAIYVTAKTPRWRRSELYRAMENRRAGSHQQNSSGAGQ
jgi:predicted DNA-binding transcriptional regulator AlpA